MQSKLGAIGDHISHFLTFSVSVNELVFLLSGKIMYDVLVSSASIHFENIAINRIIICFFVPLLVKTRVDFLIPATMIGQVASRSVAFSQRAAVQTQKRFGHWLHKNARAEENSGIRENSIATWKFDTKTIPSLLGLMFVPGILFYVSCIEELELKHRQAGSPQVFGATPGRKTMDKNE